MPESYPPRVKLKVSEPDSAKISITEAIYYGGEILQDYEILFNKPQINSVELIGDKSFDELGLRKITNSEIERILQS